VAAIRRDLVGGRTVKELRQVLLEELQPNAAVHGISTSLELTALTALAASVLGLSAAVALNRLPSRHVQLLISLFLSPLIVLGVVIGFALLICYARGRAQSLARTRDHLSGYLLRWHRRPVAQKWNFTHRRGPSRPGIMRHISDLIVHMAQDNPSGEYTACRR
jgi:hypothetical protein